MNVKPFDLGSCPAVGARQAHATLAALQACAMLPERWDVELPPLGVATIVPAGIDCDDRRGGDVELALTFGAGAARLAVDPLFAARLCDRVLGGRGAVPAVVRPLGPAERGVLAAVLAPIWDALGGTVDLGTTPGRNADVAPIVIRVGTEAVAGHVRLALAAGDGVSDERREPLLRARAGRLRLAADVEIARTRLLYRELTGLTVGDAVVFDGVDADVFAPSASWPGRLRVGAYAAALAIAADGELSIIDGFGADGFRGQQGEENPMATTDSKLDATAVLASAPVEVVAELGRITLRGDQLLGLTAGAVLALGRGRQNVSLRVAGEVWADGEIVDVDGQLGVRVTRVAPR